MITSPQVFTWGCNDEGALGREIKDGEEYSPGQVEGLLDKVVVVQLSAGDSHTAALVRNGDVYCWGVFRVSILELYHFPEINNVCKIPITIIRHLGAGILVRERDCVIG